MSACGLSCLVRVVWMWIGLVIGVSVVAGFMYSLVVVLGVIWSV